MHTCLKFMVMGIAVLLTAGAQEVFAEGDNTLRLGEYFLHYDAHAPDLAGSGIGAVPPGVNLSVNNVHTLYFAYVRRLSSKFDVEFAFGAPPTTVVVGKGPAKLGSVPYAGQQLATSRWIASTVLLNYKFFDDTAKLRPYVGVGVNYTHFTDNTATAAGNAAFGGPTSATLSNSFGWAAAAGLMYQVDPQWSLYGSYSLSQIKSDMTANTSGAIRTTTVDFHPSALVFSVGYSF
ncbi:MAG: outer membrane beta-barrel protein [Ferrovum sp.]|nr:outer membrane beta-barrel protein [Ferrovum sp.]NDU87323.1 outer membrane beta-barrel protein [Ferrovum sp.]